MRSWMFPLASGSDESIECKKPNTGYWSIVRKRRYRFSWPRREASEALSASGRGIERKKTALQDKKEFFLFSMVEKRTFFFYPSWTKWIEHQQFSKVLFFVYRNILKCFLRFYSYFSLKKAVSLIYCMVLFFSFVLKVENINNSSITFV